MFLQVKNCFPALFISFVDWLFTHNFIVLALAQWLFVLVENYNVKFYMTAAKHLKFNFFCSAMRFAKIQLHS